MRPDMAKVLTEAPRHGGDDGFPRPRLRNLEEAPLSEGMRRPHRDYKELSDVLGPLRGFLRKHTGRPWDNVFSECAEHLDRSSVAGFHVWSHLTQYVERHVLRMEGRVPIGLNERPIHALFFVHPRTGLLWETQPYIAKGARRAAPAPPRYPNVRVLSEGEMLYRHRGVWYRATVEGRADTRRRLLGYAKDEHGRTRAVFMDPPVSLDVPDVFGTTGWEAMGVYGRHVRAVSKRQLGKRELKEFGLKGGQ